MKYRVVLAIGILALLGACNTVKKSEINNKEVENKDGFGDILGTVESIENGKDGFTAKIETKNKIIYFATISIPNLGINEEYKEIEIGKEVALKGEIWKLGDDNRMTVRRIISNDNKHFELSGVVQSIQHGDDGSVYQVKSDNNDLYLVGISFVGLGKNAGKIKEYKVEEKLTVVGELWILGDKKHVTVKDIK